MKLKMLKPRLTTTSTSRVQMQQPFKPGTVERLRGRPGQRDRERIRLRDNGLCQQCKPLGRLTLGDVVDHRRPLWAGGDDSDANKWLLCHKCHDAKTAREAAMRASGGIP